MKIYNMNVCLRRIWRRKGKPAKYAKAHGTEDTQRMDSEVYSTTLRSVICNTLRRGIFQDFIKIKHKEAEKPPLVSIHPV